MVTDLAASRDFYLSALAPLNFVEAEDSGAHFVRLTNGTDMVIVLAPVEARFQERGYHRKSVGMNHFAISVDRKEDVDAMSVYLQQMRIPLLGSGTFETTYRGGYCGLMFEDPDRIMIEIVHHHSHYFDL